MPFNPGPTTALARILAERLKQCSIGEQVTYKELSAVIGFPIQSKMYLAIRAITMVNSETGALFINIRGVGYERLAHDALPGVGRHGLKRIRGIARRTVTLMSNTLVRANDISDKARKQAYSIQATLGLIRYSTYDRNMPTPEGGEAPPTHQTVRKTIEALRESRT